MSESIYLSTMERPRKLGRPKGSFCGICCRSWPTHKEKLKTHKYNVCPVVYDALLYQCSKCKKRFKSKHGLRLHQKKSICGIGRIGRTGLARVLDYKCPHAQVGCTLDFVTKKDVDRHAKICQYKACYVSYLTTGTYQELELNHACAFCDSKFGSKHELLRHRRDRHPCLTLPRTKKLVPFTMHKPLESANDFSHGHEIQEGCWVWRVYTRGKSKFWGCVTKKDKRTALNLLRSTCTLKMKHGILQFVFESLPMDAPLPVLDMTSPVTLAAVEALSDCMNSHCNWDLQVFRLQVLDFMKTHVPRIFLEGSVDGYPLTFLDTATDRMKPSYVSEALRWFVDSLVDGEEDDLIRACILSMNLVASADKIRFLRAHFM